MIRKRVRVRIATAIVASVALTSAAHAQTLSIGFETRHDESAYHFDNPSSWDTPFTVPHYFEQRYSADKHFLVVRGRYTGLGTRWETEVAVTPDQSARGSDFDTFFQPDGDVVTHGGATDVDLRAFRLSESVVMRTWAGAEWRAGYQFSRDRFDFPPSLSETTHTKPPSYETNWSDTRETTISDVHDFRIGVVRSGKPSPQWTIEGSVDASPLMLARLTTMLPDKYPGQSIRFSAKSYGASARLAATWQAGRFGVLIAAGGGIARPYSSTDSFRRTDYAAEIAIVLGR